MKSPASSALLRRIFLSAVATSSLFSASHAFGQVNGAGPSDSSLFDRVINIPTDPNLGIQESIGGDGETTQLNLSQGGSIGDFFEVLSGAEVNISGGNIGGSLQPFNRSLLGAEGSELNITGGTIINVLLGRNVTQISGGSFETIFSNASVLNIDGGDFGYVLDDVPLVASVASPLVLAAGTVNISGGNFDGSNFGSQGGIAVSRSGDAELSISGGVFGNGVDFRNGGVEFVGGEFELNGEAYTDSTISLGFGDVFTGVFQDGSAFVFGQSISQNSSVADLLTDVQLTQVSLPSPTSTDFVINSPESPDTISSLRDGQSLTVAEGGSFQKTFESVGGNISVAGGSLGDVEAFESSVAVSAGSIEKAYLWASSLEIDGGEVNEIYLNSSQANITNGLLSNAPENAGTLRIENNSILNISGGTIDLTVSSENSEVMISGDSILDGIFTDSSQVSISGGFIRSLSTNW